ncbi:hypothetical protein CC77DRAFT_711743 [Alternaria alternata]|uniref:Uncharacterized protein n=1 Tax=Alternaria alternata TaxID=5599 RepID=A0A177DUE1_ALTAL|nr:hypothetical protein CC77DRAFT_711743 [Alternaria alternata]OAG23354.1 hypothetical protein CC77DRAFT_711743 [Alternaria alternata]
MKRFWVGVGLGLEPATRRSMAAVRTCSLSTLDVQLRHEPTFGHPSDADVRHTARVHDGYPHRASTSGCVLRERSIHGVHSSKRRFFQPVNSIHDSEKRCGTKKTCVRLCYMRPPACNDRCCVRDQVRAFITAVGELTDDGERIKTTQLSNGYKWNSQRRLRHHKRQLLRP